MMNLPSILKTIQNLFQKGFADTKKLDAALSDLRQSSAMSTQELEKFCRLSNDLAKELGVSTEAILRQAAALSKLGITTAESAAQLTELGIRFAAISPGMDAGKATASLADIMQAYKISASDASDGILSKINEVGNRFQTSNAEIAEGLQKSSAAMAGAGETIETTIGLFAGGQEVIRDASEVGEAIRSIALRMQACDSETGMLSGDLADLAEQVAELTKTAGNRGGISLFADSSRTEPKDMLTLLGELSEIWSELDANSRTDLAGALFGAEHTQAGTAIIENFAQVGAAIDVMAESAGSADREFLAMTDSLNHKLNTASAAAAGIFENLFPKEELASAVDTANGFLGILDRLTEKLGPSGALGLGAGLFAGLKNVGGAKTYAPVCFENADHRMCSSGYRSFHAVECEIHRENTEQRQYAGTAYNDCVMAMYHYTPAAATQTGS